jgi:Outer membrane protein beta-barrel domain
MKNVILIWVCLCFQTLLLAQSRSIGVRSGVSLGHFYTGTEPIKDPSLPKLIVNAFYENRFKKWLSYTIGLSYFGTGSIENSLDRNGIPINLKWSYDYLSIPFSMKFLIGNKVRPYGKLGGNIAYLLNSNGLPFNAVRDVSEIKYVNLNDETKKIDYGILAGFGLETSINSAYELGIEVNGYYGLPKFDTYSTTLMQHYVSVELVFKYNID